MKGTRAPRPADGRKGTRPGPPAPVFPLVALGVNGYLAGFVAPEPALSDAPLTLLPGTLELLILRALRWEPTHGAGVGEWIRLVTDGAFAVEEGTLYPALHRLARRGWIESEWGRSDHGRRARFYHLTGPGRQQLPALVAEWERYADAVDRAIRYGNPRGLWAARSPSSPASHTSRPDGPR